MSDDLFQPDPADVPLVDPAKDYTDELVGEGKRYRDQAAASRALVEKDNFIEQLKRENSEVRQALATRSKEEDFLKKLEALTQPPPPPEPAVREGEVQNIQVEDIERMIDARDAKRVANENLGQVTSRLRELFGPDYKARVAQTAKELGIGTDFLTATAAKSPEAFYKLIGVSEQRQQGFDAPPRSSVVLQPAPQGSKKTYADFQKLRKEKGDSWYFSVPVQQEIWKEAKAQGEAFGLSN